METNKKPIFLWDLHEVVFRKSWGQLLRSIVTFQAKKNLLKQIPKNLINFYKHKLKHQKKKPLSVADILYFAESENDKALIDFTFKICCAYTPITQTVALIKLLKNQGFVHHIGSNIARPVFEQFKEYYPDIFALFDYAHVVDVVSYEDMIQKPDPLFFSSYLEIQQCKPEDVFFIDNKKKNVNTAKLIGLQTIHFKRPSQLKKELRHFLQNS